jgi:large subunit ribosomal protein L22
MSPEHKPDKADEVEPKADATERKPAARGRSSAESSAEGSAAKKPAAKKPAAKQPAVKEPAAEKAAEAKASPAKKPAKEAASGTEKPAAEKKPASEKKAVAPRPKPAKPPRRRVVRARARYVRTSARKARMVSAHLPGKSVTQARAILAFTPREVARDWSKLLESAVANAEHNHELLEDDLVVREAYADEGPTIKRFRPRAMGRATPIHKRTSHLTITLTPGS